MVERLLIVISAYFFSSVLEDFERKKTLFYPPPWFCHSQALSQWKVTWGGLNLCINGPCSSQEERPTLQWMDGSGTQEHCQSESWAPPEWLLLRVMTIWFLTWGFPCLNKLYLAQVSWKHDGKSDYLLRKMHLPLVPF